MKVLKANHKIEEKWHDHLRLTGHSQDEAKGLYWMYKINGEMAPKGAAETTVKKGTRSNSIKKCINNEKLDSVAGFRLKIKDLRNSP